MAAPRVLITDPGAPAIRATFDVDAIAEITSYAEYIIFSGRLRALGFSEDSSDGAPVCRWVSGPLVLDVMPLAERVLGFSNQWYEAAMRNSVLILLEPSLQIRSIAAPVFLATKLEAFRNRGKGDYFGSHDPEDALAVIDGRASLVQEVRSAPEELRGYLAGECRALLRDPRFIDAIPGHLPPDSSSQARVPLILGRIEAISRRNVMLAEDHAEQPRSDRDISETSIRTEFVIPFGFIQIGFSDHTGYECRARRQVARTPQYPDGTYAQVFSSHETGRILAYVGRLP